MKGRISSREWAEGLNRAAESSGRPSAVVAGAGVAGLGCIRSLEKRGIPTTAIDWRSWELGLHSRYTQPLVLSNPALTPGDWLDFLLEAGRALETRPVLLMAADAPLRLVSAHRGELAAHYAFCIPPRNPRHASR
jgi:predicted ATP-grasp superfamily ATP-dependent carboligase